MITDSDKIALISNGKEITYHTLLQKIYLFSQALNVQQGDRVLVFSEPSLGYVYALFAIWEKKASYSAWFYNSDAEGYEIAINDIQPKVIFVSIKRYPLLKEALKNISLDIEILLLDELEKIPVSPRTPIAELKIDRTHIAFRVFTAGITNAHKAIELTFNNMMFIVGKLAVNKFYTNDDKVLVLLPFYNNWILISTLLVPLLLGATCIFAEDNIDSIIDSISKYNVTILVWVERVYKMLFKEIFVDKKLANKDSIKYKLASKINNAKLSKIFFNKVHKLLGNNIRYFLTVGAKLREETYKPLLALGFEVLEGYGLAEASSLITYPTSKRKHPASVGKIIDGLNYKLINGELVLKGHSIGNRYYNRDLLNKMEFNNGWFFTSDLVEIDDDGYVILLGRMNDDIILKTGRIINPSELEEALNTKFDYILECGIYYDSNIEKIKAVIVPTPEMVEQYGRDNDYLMLHNIIRWKIVELYNHNMPPHKRINRVIITEERFSRSTSGKIKRYLLPKYEKRADDADIDELLGEQSNTLKFK